MDYKMLDISTAHISPETDKWLENNWETGLPVDPLFAGFLIMVPSPDLMNENWPEDFRLCLEYCMTNKYDYLKLDGDGEIITDLPTYNWD